jgi:hypothetical protein
MLTNARPPLHAETRTENIRILPYSPWHDGPVTENASQEEINSFAVSHSNRFCVINPGTG